ncbi:MAG: DNRLRE domain-containing protein, partial [Candidatus Binataceae bacterium]
GTRDSTISVDPRISDVSLGADAELGIWQFGGVVLIEFDFDYSEIPTDASVKAASLELYCVSVGFTDEEIARPWEVGVYECSTNWREGSGTPKTKIIDGATLKTTDGRVPWRGGSPTAAVGTLQGTATIAGANRWYRWPLDPKVIANSIAGRRENLGYIIQGKAPGKAVSFASREWGTVALRPILRLELEMPKEEVARLGTGLKARRIEAVSPYALSRQVTYRLSRETVLMPHYQAEQALAQQSLIKKIPARSLITVLEKKDVTDRTWYRVIAKGDLGRDKDEGWINSLALIGQELEPVEEPPGCFLASKGLGVSRADAIRFFKQVDDSAEFSRLWPVLGQPCYAGSPRGVGVNLDGPREDLLEIAFSFNSKTQPAFVANDPRLGRLTGLPEADWRTALRWVEEQLARAKSGPFPETTMERGNTVIAIERIGDDVFISFETKHWRSQKAPE